MRWLLVLVLLLTASLLAGCTGEDDVTPTDGDGPGTPPGTNDADAAHQSVLRGEEPAPWDVGHYWSYRTSFGTDFTLVVTEDQGSDWYLDTTGEDTAWFHVRDPISYLEQVRKDDLAGSQGTDRVQYFDFPLEEGKEWTTPWDGTERRIVTVEANETFRFEAYEDGQLAVEYDYDPETGWFTHVVFYEGEDGQESFSFELSDHQTGWTGQVVRWDAENDHRGAYNFYPTGGAGSTLSVGDHEEIWVRIWFHCDGEATVEPQVAFTMGPAGPVESPDGGIFHEGCMDQEHIQIVPEPEGEWVYYAHVLDPDDITTLEIEAWTRTLVTHTVE